MLLINTDKFISEIPFFQHKNFQYLVCLDKATFIELIICMVMVVIFIEFDQNMTKVAIASAVDQCLLHLIWYACP